MLDLPEVSSCLHPVPYGQKMMLLSEQGAAGLFGEYTSIHTLNAMYRYRGATYRRVKLYASRLILVANDQVNTILFNPNRYVASSFHVRTPELRTDKYISKGILRVREGRNLQSGPPEYQ